MPSIRTALLGAGASVPAGLPTTLELFNSVFAAADFTATTRPGLKSALDVTLGGLRFADPRGQIDIEQLYQALRGLSRRRDSFLAPFVGAWHERVALAERIASEDLVDQAVEGLARDVSRYVSGLGRGSRFSGISPSDFGNFRHALVEALETIDERSGAAFDTAADEVLRHLVKRCWLPEAAQDRVAYLAPLLRSSAISPLWIASLNYDNALELAGDSSGTTIDRGVHSSSRIVRFDAASPLTLAKLHGSLDWTLRPDGTLEITPVPDVARQIPTMIFGAGNKLRITGPYLDLLLAFRSRLEQTETLEVCGYSFRDVHVNYLIFAWLEGAPGRSVAVASRSLTLEKLSENFNATMTEAVAETILLPAKNPVSVDPNWYRDHFKVKKQDARDWAEELAKAT